VERNWPCFCFTLFLGLLVSVGNPIFKFGGISIVTGAPFFTECFLVSGYVAENVWFLSFKFHPIKVGQRSSSVPHE
jgi:hypothetical protein